MTQEQFQNLSYGNILQDAAGNKWGVLHTNRDAENKVTGIFVMKAFTSGESLTLVDTTSVDTVVVGTDGKTVIGLLKIVSS
jgi:hypothetical protein